MLSGFSSLVIFLSFYIVSCGRLSWLNCRLSSACYYRIITSHITHDDDDDDDNVQEKWNHGRTASGSKRSDGSFSDSSNSFVRQVKLLTSNTQLQHRQPPPRITNLSLLATMTSCGGRPSCSASTPSHPL